MRKNKKYNPLKQLDLVAKVALKHSAIGCVAGKGGCQLIDLRNLTKVPATENKVRLLSTLRHQWSVFIAVFGIDDNNVRYMKSEEIAVTYPVRQEEMIDTLNTRHLALGKNFNHKHLLSYGWLATPYLKEWKESQAFEILETFGAFDFKKLGSNEVVEA